MWLTPHGRHPLQGLKRQGHFPLRQRSTDCDPRDPLLLSQGRRRRAPPGRVRGAAGALRRAGPLGRATPLVQGTSGPPLSPIPGARELTNGVLERKPKAASGRQRRTVTWRTLPPPAGRIQTCKSHGVEEDGDRRRRSKGSAPVLQGPTQPREGEAGPAARIPIPKHQVMCGMWEAGKNVRSLALPRPPPPSCLPNYFRLSTRQELELS